MAAHYYEGPIRWRHLHHGSCLTRSSSRCRRSHSIYTIRSGVPSWRRKWCRRRLDHLRWTQTHNWTLVGYPVTLAELVLDISRATDRDGLPEPGASRNAFTRRIRSAGTVHYENRNPGGRARDRARYAAEHFRGRHRRSRTAPLSSRAWRSRFPACTGKPSATAATSPSPRAASSGSNP
jgi:hypothetical protein